MTARQRARRPRWPSGSRPWRPDASASKGFAPDRRHRGRLPPGDRLLVIPLVICSLLPYAGAPHPGGGFLVDLAAVTLVPSLAWARAAHSPRPDGPSVGAFHPGNPPATRLELAEDRRAFEELVGRDVLERRARRVGPDLRSAVREPVGPDRRLPADRPHAGRAAPRPRVQRGPPAGALVPLTDLVAYVLPLVDEIARRGVPQDAGDG